MNIVNLDKYFSGKYITSEKLTSNEELSEPLVISEVKIETIGDIPKVCIGFVGVQETLVLNKTNYEKLKRSLGEDSDKWVSARVTLKLQEVEYQGKEVDAVRIATVNKQEKVI